MVSLVIEICLKCYGASRSIILGSEEVFKKELTFGLYLEGYVRFLQQSVMIPNRQNVLGKGNNLIWLNDRMHGGKRKWVSDFKYGHFLPLYVP